MLGIEANKNQQKVDTYQDRIYIRDVGNMVAYNTTEENEAMKNAEKQHNEIETIQKEEKKPQRKKKNQILLSEEELKQLEMEKQGGN